MRISTIALTAALTLAAGPALASVRLDTPAATAGACNASYMTWIALLESDGKEADQRTQDRAFSFSVFVNARDADFISGAEAAANARADGYLALSDREAVERRVLADLSDCKAYLND